MKKLLVLLFTLVLLTGCSGAAATNATMADNFSEKMMNGENQTSVIYLNAEPANVYDTAKVKLFMTDVYYENMVAKNEETEICGTTEDLDAALEAYFAKFDELKGSYNELLANLGEPVEDVKINGEVIVGIETKDETGINTAFLYTNNVVKVIIGDDAEFYTVTDEEAAAWQAVYFDFMTFYDDEANTPCFLK